MLEATRRTPWLFRSVAEQVATYTSGTNSLSFGAPMTLSTTETGPLVIQPIDATRALVCYKDVGNGDIKKKQPLRERHEHLQRLPCKLYGTPTKERRCHQ